MAEGKPSNQTVASYLRLDQHLISGLVSMMDGLSNTQKDVIASVKKEGDENEEEEDFEIINKDDTDNEPLLTPDEAVNKTHPLPLSPIQKRFLKERPSATQIVCQQLEQHGIQATINHAKSQVLLETNDQEKVAKALQLIEDSVMELTLNYKQDDLKMMADLPGMKDGIPLLPMSKSDQEVLVLIDDTEDCITLVGLKITIDDFQEHLHESQELVSSMVSSNAAFDNACLEDQPTTSLVHVKENELSYLFMSNWEEITSIATDENGLSFTPNDDGVEVSGPTLAVRDAVERVKAIVGQICSDKFTLESGVNMKSFTDATIDARKNHNVAITYRQNNTRLMPMTSQIQITSEVGPSPETVRQQPKVSIVFGRLENHQAEVLVNTTNSRLILSMGQGVSHSLLRAAGNGIQDELNSRYPRGMGHGDIAMSGPGSLTNCKAIFHAALPYYKGCAETMDLFRCYSYLLSVTFRALTRATREGYKSIAFPAFATGTLQYPTKNVVQLMFKAFECFNQENTSGSIRDIFIVMTHDTNLPVKQMFLAQGLTYWMKTRQLFVPYSRKIEPPLALLLRVFSGNIGQSENNSDFLQTEVAMTNEPKCEVRFKIGKTLVQILHGEVAKACDYTSNILVPWVGKEINARNDHPTLKCIEPNRRNFSCHRYMDELRRASYVVDDNTLSGKTLIHTYSDGAVEKSLDGAIRKGLRAADARHCRSLLLPIAGEGTLARKCEEAVNAIVSAVRSVTSGLYVLTILIPEQTIFVDFATRFSQLRRSMDTADISMVEFVDDQWSSQFSNENTRSLTRAAAFTPEVDAVMVVSSDSRQRNRDAAIEVARQLSSPLYDVVTTLNRNA